MEYRPRLIFWELTTGCNLRCIHCRASAGELASPDDLSTRECMRLIDQFAEYAPLILVLSGGEPLYRRDVLDLARYARSKGLKVALATNGTLVTPQVADQIVDAGILRVAMSLDGVDAATHDSFRGMPGSYDAMMTGFRLLKQRGMSVQLNTTIARHNAHQLPEIYELALRIGADALHTFLLVPVGCGVQIAEQQMVPAEQYEEILNWFYDREMEARIELKATCAPHYFRVRKQRQVAEKRAGLAQIETESAPGHTGPVGRPTGPEAQGRCPNGNGHAEHAAGGHPGSAGHPGAHAPAAMMGGHPQAATGGHPGGHASHGIASRHPELSAVTRGCLAGSGVCFVSHKGDVYPCGYLPAKAGDLRTQLFRDVWEKSMVFHLLRDTTNLDGKCRICEYRNICEGCRARAYAATGDYLAEEPFCAYTPRQLAQQRT